MKTILFQGDSITDAFRKDEIFCGIFCGMGLGYPGYVAARLGLDHPGEYDFINRGISGNRIVDVYARIKQDIINLKPDVVSLLIGVNDVLHEFSAQNGVATDKFIKIYKMLLDELQEALPNTKIILMEPFILNGTGTVMYYESAQKGVLEKAMAVRQIAVEYELPFVELQKGLDKLTEEAPGEYWLLDGVHPNIYFHQYIADRWIETYNQIK